MSLADPPSCGVGARRKWTQKRDRRLRRRKENAHLPLTVTVCVRLCGLRNAVLSAHKRRTSSRWKRLRRSAPHPLGVSGGREILNLRHPREMGEEERVLPWGPEADILSPVHVQGASKPVATQIQRRRLGRVRASGTGPSPLEQRGSDHLPPKRHPNGCLKGVSVEACPSFAPQHQADPRRRGRRAGPRARRRRPRSRLRGPSGYSRWFGNPDILRLYRRARYGSEIPIGLGCGRCAAPHSDQNVQSLLLWGAAHRLRGLPPQCESRPTRATGGGRCHRNDPHGRRTSRRGTRSRD